MNLRTLSLTCVAAVFVASAQAQSTFVAIGPGGTFPTSIGGVDGNYPHLNQTNVPSLPPNQFTTTVTVPAGATRITSLVVRGLRHP